MKARKVPKGKEKLVVFLLFILFVVLTVITTGDKGLSAPDYTVFSTGENGASLLYDTLKRMGLPVGTDFKYIASNTDKSNLQVMIKPNPMHTSNERIDEIIDWAKAGGKLLYFGAHFELGGSGDLFTDRLFTQGTPDSVMQTFGGLILRYGLGTIYISEAEIVANKNLMESAAIGQEIADVLNSFGSDKVLFNEAYHGYAGERGFFDILPFGFKLLFYQILLITAAVVIYFGKRFGKPLTYYEEVEREENEYVYTLSNLYMSTGMGGAALSAYEDKFKDLARRYFRRSAEPDYGEILGEWEKNNMEGLSELKYIISKVDKETDKISNINTNKKSGAKEFEKLASSYKYLIKIVTKTM